MKELGIAIGLITGSIAGWLIYKNTDFAVGEILATIIFAGMSHFYSHFERK